MKKQAGFRMALGLMLLTPMLLAAACAASGTPFLDAPAPAASPTSAPTPTPKPKLLLVFPERAPDYAGALLALAEETDYTVVSVPESAALSAQDRATGADCAAVFCVGAGEPGLPALDCPVLVCALPGADIPAGAPFVRYDDALAARLALEQAAAYEPHIAPVRMIGLFTSEDSGAFAAWEAASDAGTVYDRGAYFADGEGGVERFFERKLAALYPGQLDCVFAETGALACEAADALAVMNRFDAEIFAADAGGEALKRMQSGGTPIVCAVGMHVGEAARVSFQRIEALRAGNTPVNVTLGPKAFYAEDAVAP